MKSEHSKMEYVRLTIEEYEENYQIIKSLEKTIEVFKKKNEELLQKSVKHGKWLISSNGYYPYCSECGEEPKNREMTKFCAECGAKMDKELLNK